MTRRVAGPLDRAVACVEEAAVSTWRRRPFVLATVAAIGMSLTFPALAVVVLSWLDTLVRSEAAGERVRVFLATEDAAVVARARAALEQAPGVTSVEFLDSAAARESFAERFPELADLSRDLSSEELTFPPTLEARLTEGAAAGALAARLQAMPGVEEVRRDEAWGRGLVRARRALRAGRLAITVLALAVTAFGVGNVIRINALSRREELAIMRLVGAPGFHVRVPFVLEGALQGALGGLFAAGLVTLATWLLGARLEAIVPAAHEGVPARAWAALTVLPAVAGMAGAAVAVEGVLRRHARLER